MPGRAHPIPQILHHIPDPGRGQGPIPRQQGQLLSCARPPVMLLVAVDSFACPALSARGCQAPRHVGCSPSWGPLHRAKGAFLIFTGMKTFPKSKCLGGFEEFPLEMKQGCLRAPAIAAEPQLLGTPGCWGALGSGLGVPWAGHFGHRKLPLVQSPPTPSCSDSFPPGSTLGIVCHERQPTKGRERGLCGGVQSTLCTARGCSNPPAPRTHRALLQGKNEFKGQCSK